MVRERVMEELSAFFSASTEMKRKEKSEKRKAKSEKRKAKSEKRKEKREKRGYGSSQAIERSLPLLPSSLIPDCTLIL
jgi:hypothetical protein